MISEGEQRFERLRNTTGFILGPAVFVLLYLLPLSSLSPTAHRLAAIMGLVVMFWLTEPIPIPITAILGQVLCVLCGVGSVKQVLSGFGHPLILLFFGSFILAKAMTVHSVSRRFALGILSNRLVAHSPYRVMFVLGAVTALLSMWISNTATAAMMYPIGLGILSALHRGDVARSATELTRTRFGTGVMLLIAYSASIGGIATPVGSPPNLIAMAALERLAGVPLSFFQWMAFALPLAAVLFLLLFAYLARVCPPDTPTDAGTAAFFAAERATLGGWTPGQRNTVIAFVVTVLLWITPGAVALVAGVDAPTATWLDTHLPESVVALIGATLLFFLPVNWPKRKFTLEVKQALAIDWGTLILFGGGLALGELMFQTGLAKAVGSGLEQVVGTHTPLAMTALAVGLAIVMTETTSNTASANMVVPIVIAMAAAAHIPPLTPALGAAVGCSLGFLLPVSTPPNAIVYSSGLVPITKMVRYGLVMSLVSFLIVTLFATYGLPAWE